MNPLMRNNSQQNIISRFQEFKRQMAGQDPNKVLQDMLASGQIRQEQIDEATNIAKNLSKILK